MVEIGSKLFDEVLADAQTKAERTRNRGQRDAEAAARRIDEQIEGEVEQIMAEGRKQADARQHEIMATVEIEAQRERLALLEESLTAVRRAAEGLLKDIPADRRRQSVEGLTRQALEMAPPGQYELSLPADMHQAHAARLAAELTAVAADELGREIKISPASQPAASDGPILRSTDGRTLIDQSLAERLRRLWPQLRLEAAKSLFG